MAEEIGYARKNILNETRVSLSKIKLSLHVTKCEVRS